MSEYLKNELSEDELYKLALKRIKIKRDFISHWASYVAVNAFLVALNLLSSPDNLWFYWPLGGWGIGLFIHAVDTYSLLNLTHNKQAVEKEMDKIRNNHND